MHPRRLRRRHDRGGLRVGAAADILPIRTAFPRQSWRPADFRGLVVVVQRSDSPGVRSVWRSSWPRAAPPKPTALIHDRDPLYTKAWRALLKSGGVKCVPIPAHSPNCSPHAEPFVRTIRTECLDQFVIFGERHLRYLVEGFVDHYLTGRYHQGLGGQLIRPPASASNDNAGLGPIRCRSRLGGLLNHCHREAA